MKPEDQLHAVMMLLLLQPGKDSSIAAAKWIRKILDERKNETIYTTTPVV